MAELEIVFDMQRIGTNCLPGMLLLQYRNGTGINESYDWCSWYCL